MMLLLAANAFAFPNSFIYQGSVKNNDKLINDTLSMEIRLTDESGANVYWTSGPQWVDVVDGLFRIELAPTNIDWGAIDPYIETRIAGTVLAPREKMAGNVYAQMARSLAPGAVLSVFPGNYSSPSIYPSTRRNTGLYFDNGRVGFAANGLHRLFVGDDVEVAARLIPDLDNKNSLGADGRRWSEVWAANGVVQMSSSRNKEDIRELNLQTNKKVILPRAIVYKWKGAKGKQAQKDYIGFMGDDLPVEAQAVRADGSRDPDNYYTSAVIGIMAAKIHELEARIAALEAAKPK
jgi:hypothetical protein